LGVYITFMSKHKSYINTKAVNVAPCEFAGANLFALSIFFFIKVYKKKIYLKQTTLGFLTPVCTGVKNPSLVGLVQKT